MSGPKEISWREKKSKGERRRKVKEREKPTKILQKPAGAQKNGRKVKEREIYLTAFVHI